MTLPACRISTHPAAAALAGQAVDVAGLPAAVVLVALDDETIAAGGGARSGCPARDDEVDALVRRAGSAVRKPEPTHRLDAGWSSRTRRSGRPAAHTMRERVADRAGGAVGEQVDDLGGERLVLGVGVRDRR